MSFDLNSLYPHLIMQYNMSPETLVTGDYMKLDVDTMLKETPIDIPDTMYYHTKWCVVSQRQEGFPSRDDARDLR